MNSEAGQGGRNRPSPPRGVAQPIPGLDRPGIPSDQLDLIAHAVNALAGFLGRRDLASLDHSGLATAGFTHADVLVLFGGSILEGADLLALAMRRRLATRYMIVGGEGHTTALLRHEVAQHVPSLLASRSEADLIAQYLSFRYGLDVDLLERRSTNCGTNVTNCLELLHTLSIPHRTIIAIQDATMQLRMDAGFRKHLPPGHQVINFAAYSASVVAAHGRLQFERPPAGMWHMSQYVSLLLGEIPRLTDDDAGYGPNGRGFIARVEIPDKVSHAHRFLSSRFPSLVRQANSRWAVAM
ncbi:Protein YdcF [Propionicimonas sp. T2.31MG-18]|uniref:YdcF family protein n=1 Tax=Propionicimonas sp. T2.31MG-18 TaxID=3157620 RepID=UPI0035E6B046